VDENEYSVMRSLEDRHWWYRSLRSLVLARVGSAGLILDAGCGTGGMLASLRGRRAVGVDFAASALAGCRDRGLDSLAGASVSALPFAPDTFDAVLLLDVIYHRRVEDDGLAVAECARVLKPGGIVILHAPAYRWLFGAHDRAVHGARRYTVGRVRQLVRAAGLTVEELTYRNLPALPAAVCRPLGNLPPFRRRRNASSDLRPLPSPINGTLHLLSRAENRILDFLALPAGLSVFCTARKCP
jgi:SAM-dependent methyltransferase